MQSVHGAPPALAQKDIMMPPPGLDALPTIRAPPGLIHPSEEEVIETMNKLKQPSQDSHSDDETRAGSSVSESEASDSESPSRRGKAHDEAQASMVKMSVKASVFVPNASGPSAAFSASDVRRTKLTLNASAFVPRRPTEVPMPPPGLRTQLSSAAPSFKPRMAA